ncbi:transcription factor/nuclear export subunit protein 2-domain-containing protein [Stachybotrys elegans]|uniref:THO complex subunit 2 n=1 Tax=Stachybotrys elegans TaxID=80388 RepID=A0A8K0WTV2_9HYPO|nr:transcription factor/nuclear export subunit protein 2-domain-containing protein [Stachybotrys elegans]
MPPKRKRSGPTSGEGSRPSPHRPGDTPLGQHDRDDGSGRGRGRPPRGPNRRDSNHGYGRNSQNHTPVQSPTSQRHAPAPQSRPPSQPQQPPTPSPTTAKMPSDVVQRPPSPARTNYRYDNLTDEKIRTWAERGRSEIIKHGVQSREDFDITELSTLFEEFVHAVVEGRLDPADAGACVKEIIGDETSEIIKDSYAFAPHTLFLDSLAVVMDNDTQLYRPSLRDFLIATGVSLALMRQILDAPQLQQLGLIRDTFARVGVRQATNQLYRQANYNLLREETEGYSKLITELFTTSSTAVPPPEMAEQTFERIKALIGTFDLDVGRVLDVTLDVAAAVLIKQYKFFVKLLRVSSWWPRTEQDQDIPNYFSGLPPWAQPGYPQWTTTEEDEALIIQSRSGRDAEFWQRAREIHLAAFFELGGRRADDSTLQQAALTNGESNEDSAPSMRDQWIKETKTLLPPGNRVAAQLLGFKLLFYNSEHRDENDILPANLLYLAALLIKIGFLSLTDLYPHLSPVDDEMDKVREQQLKKMEEEERSTRGGPMNALLMAGVLPQGDDDNPTMSNMPRKEPPKKLEAETKSAPTEDDANKPKLKEPLEQKVLLLIQLLTIGAIPESLFILGRFPWIPETFPEVLNRIHRILHFMLEKVFAESRPVPVKQASCPTKQIADVDQSGVPKGNVRLNRLPTKKIWRWPYPDKTDTNENQTYRFYWDEWNDNIPVCQTVDDVFTLCNTFLNLSGVNIGRDEGLLAKLASIGAKSLGEDKSEANLTRWHDLLKRLLVPALSHTNANAPVVNAIWDLLKLYPTTTRYTIYAEWFEGQISRLPSMKAAFARATSDTRGTMKRVSLTNLGEMAKKLAKTSYSSPGIVFKVAFEQLESYPNLIEAFVECAKYFPDLSYDVLVWSLMSSLGKSRSRTQADHALTTSKWLQALSRFSGKVFRRYPSLDSTPVLQYVNDQLLRGNSTDLIILKEFISTMGGIVTLTDFTDYQILSMAGGSALRRHTLIRGQDKRFDNVKSATRLMQALTDSKLASRFLINMAQYRQAAIYKVPEEEAHIKYLSAVIDDSHQTLIQYLDFLWSNLEPEAFDVLVPSINELMKTFGLDISLAFLIGRASLAHRIYPWSSRKSNKPPQQEADKEGDVQMSEAKASEASGASAPDGGNDQVCADKPGPAQNPTNSGHQPKANGSFLIRSVLPPIVEAVQDTMTAEVKEKISPELYVTFWTLQLGDIFFPEAIYKQEVDRLGAEATAIVNDKSDTSPRGMQKKIRRHTELRDAAVLLEEESSEHGLRFGKWKAHLTRQFQTSFPNRAAKPESVADVLLEQCFIPRVMLSMSDAEYTFKFIKALHDWNAPGFKLMALYDRLFNANRLRSLIFTCTVREAEYMGRFLKLILEDLSRWHKNAPGNEIPRVGAYEKEGKGPKDHPHFGFALTLDDNGNPQTFVEHAQFKDLLFRWHKNLNTALKTCLAGTEWMHIRNAITVLRSVLDFFPAVDFMATQFASQLQKISKQEAASKTATEGEEGHRVDLSVAAQGAMSELQKRKSKWVMVQAFRPNAVGGSQSENDKSNLRATAPDFQPSRPTSSKPGPNEEEDGEVHDGRNGKSQAMDSSSQSTGPSKEPLPAKPSQNRDTPRKDGMASGPARSSTPKPTQPANGGKADMRPISLPDRPPHTLPNRPDVPIPGHFTPERYAQGRTHERRDVSIGRDPRGPRESRDPRDPRELRDNRETRDAREMRDGREGRLPEERQRDLPERRGPETMRDGPRADLPPRPNQHDRERSGRDGRGGRTQDRLTDQPASSLPPAPPANHADSQEPAMNPERAALFAQDEGPRPNRGPDSDRQTRGRRQGPNDTMDIVNPERAALIGDRNDNTPTRPPRDEARERGPRGHSPRRGGRYGHEAMPPNGMPDERHGRLQPPDHRPSARGPRERSPKPGSYRGERPQERDSDRPVDKPFPHQGGHEGVDHRGNAFQDQNYGRLNQVPPNNEIPSGPRGRGRGTARGGHAASPGMSGRPENRFPGPETPRAPTPERHPPTGPSSGRGRRGYDGGGPPTTPSANMGGPHGDRHRNFSSAQEGPSPAQSMPPPPPSTGVHPDRLAQIGGPSPGGPQPPSGPGSSSHGRHSMPAITPDRPDFNSSHGPGPRMSMGSMTGSPATDRDVPTGPSSTNERGKSGGGRRQIAGINNMLQQAQATMPESGRSSSQRRSQQRQLLGDSDVQVLTGGSPASTPSHERADPMRHDLTGRIGPSNGEESASLGRGESDRSRRDREGRGERSSRSSRRSSRDRDRERSPTRDRDGKDIREHRDRRSGAMGDGNAREERESRRSNRDAGGREPMPAPPPPPPGGRELVGGRDGRESRHRSDSQAGREDWVGRGGRGGHRDGGGSRSDERRESREDRNRKRRTEEGSSTDRDKRARR